MSPLLEAAKEAAEKASSHGRSPRVHGNGMIQLDLEDGSRLHVWGSPDIPRQVVQTPIHDHTFGFRSTVVVGRLFNARHDVRMPNDSALLTHEVYRPVPRVGEDTRLEPTGQLVEARRPSVTTHYPGDQYEERACDFHETFAIEPTATIMRKITSTNQIARVLVPIGKKPDNDFDRDAHPRGLLWDIIWRTLR